MASLAEPMPVAARDDRFFLFSAYAMAAVIFAGFSLQFAMGRSSFTQSPLLVHTHAVVFMGWVVLYVLQNVFAASGTMALHKRLGWIGAGWIVAMVVLGTTVTVQMVQMGRAPFFFQPLQFLVFNPLSVITFAGLTVAAIVLRRQTDWHRRLHFCGMALLLGPGFGRLLPMPLLIPWAYELTNVALLVFPVIGVIADLRRTGRVHPAWYWGIGTIVASTMLVEAITYSPVGTALYDTVVAGTRGADVAPREFGAWPKGA